MSNLFYACLLSPCIAASPLQLVSQIGRIAVISAGRLEVFIGDECGTVCSNSFGINDATLACRELGFSMAGSYATASSIGY